MTTALNVHLFIIKGIELYDPHDPRIDHQINICSMANRAASFTVTLSL